MGVVRRDDAGLRMIQAALGDIRADAELGEAGAYRSPKVMQREHSHLVFGKSVEVTCDASGQQLWVHRPVANLSREDPGASAGQALQALELLDRRRRQRHSEGNAGLGSLGGNVAITGAGRSTIASKSSITQHDIRLNRLRNVPTGPVTPAFALNTREIQSISL
jgi:hypothetical protein